MEQTQVDSELHHSNSPSTQSPSDLPVSSDVANKEAGGYFKIFAYATPIDSIFQGIGFVAACGAGAALPLMTLAFGQLINMFNDWDRVNDDGQPLVTPHKLRSDTSRYTMAAFLIFLLDRLFFVYIFIGKFLLVYLHTTMFTISATRITRTLRLAYVQAVLRQDVSYFDTCTTGSVTTRISNNANLIQTGLSEKVGMLVQSLATFVAAITVALTKNWKLALVTSTAIPAAVLVTILTVVVDSKLDAKILDIYTRASSVAEEALASIRNVAAFGAHRALQLKYEGFLDQAKIYGVKKGPVLGVQYAMEYFVMYCAYALSFWYGIRLFSQGDIDDGGTVVTVFLCIMVTNTALVIVSPSLSDFGKATAAAKDVLAMIEKSPPAIDIADDTGMKPSAVAGEIEFRNVVFNYPARPSITVLQDVSLKFEAGKTTAIVGTSGSGKSTIVGLLERWYDPKEGEVYLDGMPLRDLNLKWLRSQIGLVQQEPALFNDTIYQNVIYGLSGTSATANLSLKEKMKLVSDACVQASANSFIEQLLDGYETKVGESSRLLSGGQKQRIAIARAIISNPAILLLDEATSALDPHSEEIVEAALDRASKGKTTIIVAHRMRTVRNADKIVVMNHGRVLEQGTHESLLAQKGPYFRLVQAQELMTSKSSIDRNGEGTTKKESDINPIIKNPIREPTHTQTLHSEKDFGAYLDVSGVSSEELGSEIEVDGRESSSRTYGLFKCSVILARLQARLWPWFSAGIFASACSGGVFAAQAVLFSRLVTLFSESDMDKIVKDGNFWALMFFILAIATLVAYAGLGLFLTTTAYKGARFFRAEYFAAMLRQDISYFDSESSASLTARLTSDPQHIQDLIAGNFGVIVIVFVTLLSCSIVALVHGWRLALVAIFGCIPVLFAAGFTRMRLDFNAQEATAATFLESTRFAAEAVKMIRTVASLTLETAVWEKYAECLRGPTRKMYSHAGFTMLLFAFSETIDLLGMALAFWYGGQLISKGEYSTQQFFIVFIAIVFGGQAAGLIFGFSSNLTKTHAAANRLIGLIRQQPLINIDSTDGLPYPMLMPSVPIIDFRAISFSYPTRPGVWALRNFSLAIQAGTSTAIVGPSGSGKSTIIALLERFYDATEGEILCSGQSLTSLNVASYRASIALVSQEPTLYSGTIRANILLGAQPDADYQTAAKAANIHDFIMSLPSGYDTDVGAAGIALSGGQRQRVAIARALVRDPKVLLLDEATSALDTRSERVVQEAFAVAAKGRTVVAIAHRLSTVKGMDRIVVVDGGELVEQGTHEELLQKNGMYAKMCEAQALDMEAK